MSLPSRRSLALAAAAHIARRKAPLRHTLPAGILAECERIPGLSALLADGSAELPGDLEAQAGDVLAMQLRLHRLIPRSFRTIADLVRTVS